MKSFSPSLYLFICLVLLSCNMGSNKKNTGFNESAKQGGFDLEGKITFEEYISLRRSSFGIVELSLPDLKKKRLATGRFAQKHPEGEIILADGCGYLLNRLEILGKNGNKTAVSPCSSEIPNRGPSSSFFGRSQLSPDKKLIAAEVKYYFGNDPYYKTVILKDGKVTRTFENYYSPIWLSNNELMLASDGLYVTKLNGEPKRIDDGTLSYPVNPDIHPSGKSVVFEWNERIWSMNMDGTNLTELVSGPAKYQFPTWSPDGKYVAFISMDGYSYFHIERGIHILDVADQKFEFLDLSSILGGISTDHVPYGPLSWTE